MRKKEKGSLARIGEPRQSGSGYTTEQLELATFIVGEEVRILSLPTLEPFRVLGLNPTVDMGDIRQQARIHLAMLDDDTIRKIGLHRHPGAWLTKARWLRARIKEAWLRLEELHKNDELQAYAITRGAPNPTARDPVPPRIKIAIAAASPPNRKPPRLPN